MSQKVADSKLFATFLRHFLRQKQEKFVAKIINMFIMNMLVFFTTENVRAQRCAKARKKS